MKFEVEFAQFTKVTIEAESKEEAANMASVMDWEDITDNDPHEYTIWNINKVN